MKKPMIAALVIIMLMMATSLSAQIYKYIDKDGQKRWTDDLSQVPKEQRASVEQFEGVRDIPQETSAKQAENESSEKSGPHPSIDYRELTRESLIKEKADLDKQYQTLLEEKRQLEEWKSDKGDPAHRTELNRRISAFNAKTKQYETQLNAYKERIDAYKEKIMTTPQASDQ